MHAARAHRSIDRTWNGAKAGRRHAKRAASGCHNCRVGRAEGGNGEAAVLREGGPEEGALDGGGGPEARRLPPHPRPLLLAPRPQARRAAAVRQELQAAVDQLPAARPEEGPPLRRGGAGGHRHARAARQPLVQDRGEAPRQDGQRDQEPLEHTHQEEAPQDGHRPGHPPPGIIGPNSGPSSRAASRPGAARRSRAASSRGGGGREGYRSDDSAPHGGRERQLCFFPCLGHLAVLLLLLALGLGVRPGRGGVARAHVPLRHGHHHGRRLGLGRRLPLRRRRYLRPLLPRRWLRPGRLALTPS